MSLNPSKYIFTLLTFVAIIFFGITISQTHTKKEPPLQDLVISAPPVAETIQQPVIQLIGHSVEERAIEAYSFGKGPTHILFVGGIHGGYEWNTASLAYQVIDYLTSHQERVPENITIDIIPSMNPDALFKVTGKSGRFSPEDVTQDQKILTSARFNAHNVDLNRNFNCKWQPKSTWQSKIVSAGASPFSEPESLTIKDFILKHRPAAVIFWHSKSNRVYASQCEKGILGETKHLMNTYADASGYPAIETFDAYPVTGAAEDWLASIGIPAITVELKTHETVEFNENLFGVKAIISRYTK